MIVVHGHCLALMWNTKILSNHIATLIKEKVIVNSISGYCLRRDGEKFPPMGRQDLTTELALSSSMPVKIMPRNKT